MKQVVVLLLSGCLGVFSEGLQQPHGLVSSVQHRHGHHHAVQNRHGHRHLHQKSVLPRSAGLGVFSERLPEPSRLVHVSAVQHRHGHHHLREKAVDSLDPEMEAAIAEGKEVRRLSNEINKVRYQTGEIRKQHARAREYHDAQMDSLKNQVDIRKKQKQQDADELDNYKEEKKKHYKHLMCGHVLDGFFFGDDDKKIHVLHLCMGRKSLTHHLLLHHANSSHQLSWHHAVGIKKLVLWDSITTERLEKSLMALDRQISALDREVQAFAARCRHHCIAKGPVQTMRAELKEAKAERDMAWAEYQRDKAKWKQEREELGAQEDELGNDVYSNHHEKARLRKEAWSEVKSEFCPVINENYGINDDKIVEYATVECQE